MSRPKALGSTAALVGCGLAGIAMGWSSLSALRTSKADVCAENLKAIGIAIHAYAADNAGRMPAYPRTGTGITSRPGEFYLSLAPYGAEAKPRCPLDKHAGTDFAGHLHDFVDSSYSLAPSLAADTDLLPDGVGLDLRTISDPSDQALIADNLWTVKINGEAEWMTAHGKGRGNVLWADGRVSRDFGFKN